MSKITKRCQLYPADLRDIRIRQRNFKPRVSRRPRRGCIPNAFLPGAPRRGGCILYAPFAVGSSPPAPPRKGLRPFTPGTGLSAFPASAPFGSGMRLRFRPGLTFSGETRKKKTANAACRTGGRTSPGPPRGSSLASPQPLRRPAEDGLRGRGMGETALTGCRP